VTGSDINRLKHVIQLIHGCEAEHLSTIRVMEQCQGEAVWEGNVELFNLIDHPHADSCYAWSFFDDSDLEKVSTVLKLPPVESAAKAVRADIITRAKLEIVRREPQALCGEQRSMVREVRTAL
jgi:hypothetical protein